MRGELEAERALRSGDLVCGLDCTKSRGCFIAGERLILGAEVADADDGLGGLVCCLSSTVVLGEGIFDFLICGGPLNFVPLIDETWEDGECVVSKSLLISFLRAWCALSRSLRNFGIFLVFCELSPPVVNSTSHARRS